MASETALPKRLRLNPHGKTVRRERIFARLRPGWTYGGIAGEERVTPRRVRQIVSDGAVPPNAGPWSRVGRAASKGHRADW
jgi:hypothetical protein